MKMMGDVVAAPVDDGTTSGQPGSTSKEFGHKTLRSLKRGLGRLWRRHRGNASITEYDPCYKVAYLGNVLTGWAKGDGCVEKPVSTLWRNYVSSSRPDVTMRLTITNGGLTATTKDHGLTEYWAHRVTYCTAPASHPRLFVWVYRHEGRRLRPELRCHAALCFKESTARRLASILNTRLQQALLEFRRDKVSRQNARLSLANAVYENPSLPRRKILLSTGGQNYRPPLERSKSAPKLSAIEEDSVAEEIEQQRLLEELRTLENVARSWQEQEDWRIARLVDALNRTSGESSDENGSISSGCETASTANSEERAPGAEDAHPVRESEVRSPRRVFFSDEVLRPGATGLRRNSEGSPNFMTCTGSPKFLSSSTNRKRFLIRTDEEEEEEELEEEEEEVRSNVFDFEEGEDFGVDEVVDYRPRGESPRRLENSQERRLEGARCEKYISKKAEAEILEEDEFFRLDSLDEEADSDESGYVEAPPKSLLSQEEPKDPLEKVESIETKSLRTREKVENMLGNSKTPDRKALDQKELQDIQEALCELDSAVASEDNRRRRDKDKDFIMCPISETIRKLANASLKSSKSLEISTSTCLKALNNLKTSKSFDSSITKSTLEVHEESPSLHQRKQLLAQQGVTV
ncbi:uncharacterized protein LOC107267706 [Cephus cinctus]|uniref:Uncharacterized protein LOC107267706 n=1 Tax=Cephus cinctus TaxID=211228 RepID=A0AAJ7FJR6_CEPCN|nr:uncharacterized protein LOC107267706 [Cephus cinctus]XP_015595192.1 uncharacterized protein LOC107267706 [Cephus cinctus]